MKRMMIVGFVILLCGIMMIPTYAQEAEEVLGELQDSLGWNDETTQKVGKAMASFQENMAETMAKYEDAEEPDPQAMIGDIKKARGAYQKDLESILGKDGLKAYNEYVEKVMLDMFSDIAEIRLLDLKPHIDLTDEQIEKLRTPMGQAYLDLFRTLFKYGDQKMNTRTKIKLGKSVKKIQSSIETAQKEVLSEEQLAALEKYKEEQKQAKESN